MLDDRYNKDKDGKRIFLYCKRYIFVDFRPDMGNILLNQQLVKGAVLCQIVKVVVKSGAGSRR